MLPLNHQCPITIMLVIYKIAVKVVANMLSLILKSIMTPHYHGFVKGRSINDNILAAMIGIDYAKLTNQECFLLQLDLDKAYDKFGWSFITCPMRALGFGPIMSSSIFNFGFGAASQLLFNGRIVGSFEIWRLIRQGCPLSTLLFAICAHPLATSLEFATKSKLYYKDDET